MKLTFSNSIQKLSFISLLFFVFWLPLFEGYLPTIFGLWIGLWILEGNFKERFQKSNFKTSLFLSLLFYFILSLIATSYTSNQERAWFDVQQKLALIAFPILILGLSSYTKKRLNWIFWAFNLGLLLASIYDIGHAIQSSYQSGEADGVFHYWVYQKHETVNFFSLIRMRMSYFSYAYLSRFMHPSYFAMYLLFGISSLYHLYKTRISTSILLKLASIALALFFVFIILLLQSTAGLISLFILIPLILLTEFKFLRRKRIILLSAGFFILLAAAIYGNYFSDNPLDNISTEISKNSISTSSSIRIQIWKNSYSLWMENPIFGIGPGDVRNALETKLDVIRFPEFATGNYNLHNQYFESLVGLGIVGFFSFILILMLAFKQALKKRDSLLGYLLVILSINFFFESVLNRQAGIFFFLFFLSLLFFQYKKEEFPL